jgi:hypothetical protein
MEITTEVTELDHNDFYRIYSLKRGWLLRLLLLLALDLLLSALIPISSVYLVNTLFIGIILVPFFFGLPYILAKNRIRRLYEQTPSPNGKKTFKPFATGIEITDETATNFLRYEDIRQVERTGDYVYILTRFNGYYLLPIWCFSSESQAAHFISLATSGMAQATGKRPKTPLTFKPIYLLGLLCLIPLLGFLAGLVLLILGIVHFKDRVFIIMGAIGMLITIGIYSSLFYFTLNSDVVRNGFAEIAQTEINELVKNVEFYKLQNGTYPDSLQQLDTKDSFTNIYDPLSSAKIGDNAAPFRYSKKGNKYLLFSVGRDGKPNTADDIYPTLTNPDTSKLGFIRKPE